MYGLYSARQSRIGGSSEYESINRPGVVTVEVTEVFRDMSDFDACLFEDKMLQGRVGKWIKKLTPSSFEAMQIYRRGRGMVDTMTVRDPTS